MMVLMAHFLMLVTPNIVYPSKLIKESSNKIISKKLTAFDFYGPTCDSMDYMKGPFYTYQIILKKMIILN